MNAIFFYYVFVLEGTGHWPPKNFGKELQHQTVRGLQQTIMMQQVLIALRFYATETFERAIGDLFGVSVFLGTMLFTRINVKLLKEHFL